MKNLKKILLPVAATAIAACVGVGGAMLAYADSEVYTTEQSLDIVELIETTDYLKEDGVTFESGETVVNRSWIGGWLNQSFGIRFATQFENNAWGQTENGLQVVIGATDVFFALNEDGDLDISVYDRLLSSEQQLIQTAILQDFDATALHTWEINRVFTMDSEDDGYAVRVYVDDTLVTGENVTVYAENTAEGNGGLHDDYHYTFIKNSTGVDVTVHSTLSEAFTFEQEKDIWDVAELNGEQALFTTAGRTVQSTSAAAGTPNLPIETKIANLAWQRNAWATSSGFAFEMKAKEAWSTGADLLVFEIGSTDIRVGYDATKKQLSAYVYNWWPTQGGTLTKNVLGGNHILAEDFDSTAWHSWKVARVKAVNADGFAIRIYIDDTLALELYDPYSLNYKKVDANGNLVYCDFRFGANSGRAGHACDLTNRSGVELAVRSLMNYPSYDTSQKCTDIFAFGGNMDLQSDEGKTYANGEYVINNPNVAEACESWVTENNGIAFSFKSANAWKNAADSLQIVLGATDLRVNYQNGKLNFHSYARAHAYGAWGTRITGEWDIDVTEWNTLKIIRQKDLNATGTYGELGLRIKVYLNNRLLFTHVQPTGGMWAWAWRVVQVYNRNTGTDVAFKTTNTEKIAFEDVVVKDLPDLPASDRENYNEDGLHGVGARATINNTERIVNSIWVEEYASISNGGEFLLRSEEPWRTSGTWKNLAPLSEEEMAAISEEDFAAGKKNGTYYEENGVKYKFVTGDWTSAWKDTNGNIVSNAWAFPNFWLGDDFTRAYYKDKDGKQSKLLKPEEDMAYRYHLHIDFGIMAMQFKLTPEENLVVRVYSKYSGVVSAENLLRDESGNPVVFKTGKDGEGNYYIHHFKIARVRAKNGDGFATMVWIDGMQVVNAYDPGPMGGEGNYSHFLIDNITGRELTAISVKGLDGYKQEFCDSFDSEYAQENYSVAKWNDIVAIKTAARQQMYAESSSMLILANVKKLHTDTHKLLSAVWTKDIEQRFIEQKSSYKTALQTLVSGNTYAAAQQSEVDSVLAQAVAAIDSSEENFDCLDLIYNDYLQKITAIPSQELLDELAAARMQAKGKINAFISGLTETDYTADNYAEFAQISAAYTALIDGSGDLEEIQALGLLAVSEMQSVESKAVTALNQAKASAKATLQAYVKESDYLADDWAVVQTIMQNAFADIDSAADQTAVDAAVSAGKARIDLVAKKGTSNRIPSGSTSTPGSGSQDSSSQDSSSTQDSSSSESTAQGGCASNLSSVAFGAAVLVLGLGVVMLLKKREAENDR